MVVKIGCWFGRRNAANAGAIEWPQRFALRRQSLPQFQLPRIHLRRIDPVNRFAFFHQIEPVARDDADVFWVAAQERFLALMAREQHLLLFDLGFQNFDPLLVRATLRNLRQKRMRNRNGRGQNGQRDDAL